jgi:hypothetical protein
MNLPEPARLAARILRAELLQSRRPASVLEATPPPTVVFDAKRGGSHAAKWLPVARSLADSGIRVGLASESGFIPRGVLGDDGFADRTWFTPVPLLLSPAPRTRRHLPSLRDHIKAVPWKGSLGFAIAVMQHWIDGMAAAWEEVLQKGGIKMVVSTSPYDCLIGALIHAARERRVENLYLQTGLPGGGNWRVPACDTAVVWTRLGEYLLRLNGWHRTQVFQADCPSLPKSSSLREWRTARRNALGIAESACCVLVLGSVPVDSGRFADDNFLATTETIATGLSQATRRRSFVPFLRPHPADSDKVTERLLRPSLPSLRVSRSAPLFEDLAAADLVISECSTAMEEAYLIGRPTLQVAAQAGSVVVDFRLIGTPLVRTAETLAGYLGSFEPRACQTIAGKPTVADIIRRMLGV